jgi:ERCC4-type nuclease
MKVILDEREAFLYDKCIDIMKAQPTNTLQLSKRVIPLGDILIHTDDDKEICIIERKSLSDLIASIKDGRYEEQSHRLLHASGLLPHNILYIIEGMTSQIRTTQEKKMVYSAMTSLHFFKGFSVFRSNSVQETAEMIIWMSDKIHRSLLDGKTLAYTNVQNVLKEPTDIDQTPQPIAETPKPVPENYANVVKKVKKENLTPENIGIVLLSQIPSVSTVSATALMERFHSVYNLLAEIKKNPECMNGMTYSTNGKQRKISKLVIENIQKYLAFDNTVVNEMV